jgi:hypothetical protein
MSTSRSNPGRTHRSQNPISVALGDALAERLLQSFRDDDDAPALTVERAATPAAPARLAATHAGGRDERLKVRAMYEHCLETYRTLVRPDDTARNIDDAGAALAFFIAANLSTLHGVPVTRPMLARIERQLVGLARHLANWDATTIGERQCYFEQMAMLGVFVAGRAEKAKATGPVALREVRAAARNYLRHVLAVDPERITVDENGLALRPTTHAARGAA